MTNTHVRRRLFFAALAGAVMVPWNAAVVQAEEDAEKNTSLLPVAGIEAVLTECYETKVKENIDLYLVPTNEGEYFNRAFSNVSGFAYIRTAPEEASEWIGKIYSDTTVTVLEYDGDWTKIRSGNVEGYVPTDILYTGEKARQHEEEYRKTVATVTADVLNVRSGQSTSFEILTQITENQTYNVIGEPVEGWYPVRVEDTEGWVSGQYVEIDAVYSYAESKEAEEERIAREAAEEQAQKEAQQQQAQEAALIQSQAAMGQAVIDFACQFIGNPYVWGGTSLTNGADCSGFVQSVYRNFGIELPRTTWDMENVGTAVSYDQALPGDLVLYDGHVGLYMGDGNIVNAMNEAEGIGICSATYAPILTIRRVL